MRGTSQASLDAAQLRLAPVLAAAGEQAYTIGDQLFAVVDALDASGALRRSLADPSRPAADKAGLVRNLLSSAFSAASVDAVCDLVSGRWSSERDLVDAIDVLAIDAYLASAEARGVLEQVEHELFRIIRGLVGQREVRQALSDSSTDPARRVRLVEDLLTDRVDTVTLAICRRATERPRGERFVPALVRVSEIAAARRDHVVASVTTGAELSEAQQSRLASLLESAYGRAVDLNITVDPSVVGGLRIRIGTDVVDSTVLSRLAAARRQLAS